MQESASNADVELKEFMVKYDAEVKDGLNLKNTLRTTTKEIADLKVKIETETKARASVQMEF